MNIFIKLLSFILIAASAQASLIAHYEFNDGDLLDNEVSGGPVLVNAGPSLVTLGEGTAVFTSEPNQNTTGDNYLQYDNGDMNLTAFTVSFWFKTDDPDQDAPYAGIFSSRTSADNASWQFYSRDDGQTLVKGGTTTTDTTVPNPLHAADTWYHVFLQYNNDSTLHISVSSEEGLLGDLADDVTLALTLQLDDLLFGSNRAKNQTYGMEMANIKIYDDASVSAAALYSEGPMLYPRSLIAHYVFDDGDLYDNEVGSQYTLIEQTGGQGTTNVSLNAVDGTAVIPGGNTSSDPIAWLQTDVALSPDDFTVSLWFRTDQVDQGLDYSGLFSSAYNGVNAGNWQVHSDGGGGDNGSLCARFDGNAVAFDGAPLHVADVWYHVVVQKDSNAVNPIKLYLTAVDNGSLASPVLESTNNDITLDAFVLGVNRGLNQSYGMEMSNVRIYSTSGVSIDALFDEGPVAGEICEPALIDSFDAAPSQYVQEGSAVELSWKTYYANSFSIDQGVGDVTGVTSNGVGSITVHPTNTITYTLAASNEVHGIVTETVTVSVGEPPPDVISFSANDHYVTPGTTVTLSWTVTNEAYASISPAFGEVTALTVNGQGETNVTVDSAITYTLLVSNETATAESTIKLFTGPPRPNVVLFLVDDMGITDTSVPFIFDKDGNEQRYNFNNLYHTPAMETLASNGMRFSNAYAQSVCSPTRTSLMTGLNATGHGVTCWVNPTGTKIGTYAPPNYLMQGMTGAEDTLPRRLGAAGYRTIHSGKAHFTYQYDPSKLDPEELPTAIGFDVNIAGSCNGQPGSYLGTANYASAARPSWTIPGLEEYHGTTTFLTEACTIEANEVVNETVDRGQPFFLYMSHYAVHAPFTRDTRATNDYSSVGTTAANFATMIEGMDRSLEDILIHLDSIGVAEETLILFIGDNGSDNPLNNHETQPDSPYNDFPLRGKKGGEWEGGTRVPLLISWAKPDPTNPFQQALPIASGEVEHDIVACWDLPVTIMDAAGVELPPVVHGYDLSGYLCATGGVYRPQEILLYSPHERNGDYFANYREGDWKLIYRWQNDSFALYNLIDDPTETNNLAAVESAKVLSMTRGMARRFDAEWGTLGSLWPTFGPLSTANIMGSLDLDEDGRLDAEEDLNANGLQDIDETDPDDPDSDNDGSDDNTEVRLNLDPLDPDQAFTLWINRITGSELTLLWPSAPGTMFNIRTTTNLSTAAELWPVAVSNVPAHAVESETSRLMNGAEMKRFYKVELQ